MSQIQLTTKEARQIIINSQLLIENNAVIQDKKQLLKIIQSLGYIQIDTISVVERSHNHILWTRMPGYERSMLELLLEKDKSIFEYWSHAAAFLAMKDFRYSLTRKKRYSEKYRSWEKENKKIVKYVYDRINAEGPLQSRDFEDKKNGSEGWWNWKPSKDALDYLFHNGRLMIAGRRGFQKVYDITERILPGNVDTAFPTEREYYEHLIINSIESNGISSPAEIIYQRKYDRKKFAAAINSLAEEGKILRVNVTGLKSEYFSTNSKLKYLTKTDEPNGVHILSPFDNLTIQRKRLKDFFGFDYTIECYLPEAKRKFGYYCLPILKGDKFIGRLDAKADRATDTFIVKNLFMEGNRKADRSLQKKIKEFAEFCGCGKVTGIV